MAVMECAATARVAMLIVAVPEAFSVAAPRVVVPSLKVTLPLGVPEAAGFTVAVNVTELPDRIGFALDVSTVVVVSSIISVRAADRLEASLALPLYAAMMEWDPTARELVVKLATPDPFNVTGEPSAVAPSLKVTVPDGTGAPCGIEATVAVKVTGLPAS